MYSSDSNYVHGKGLINFELPSNPLIDVLGKDRFNFEIDEWWVFTQTIVLNSPHRSCKLRRARWNRISRWKKKFRRELWFFLKIEHGLNWAKDSVLFKKRIRMRIKRASVYIIFSILIFFTSYFSKYMVVIISALRRLRIHWRGFGLWPINR